MKRIKTNSLGSRIISGLLSVLMIMSACPTTAFADYEDETSTLVISEEQNVDDEDEATTAVDSTSDEDENVNSIPTDEDAEDQTEQDVDTPPNIDDTSEEDTENINETNEYKVILPKTANATVGEGLTVKATVEGVDNVNYSFEFSVNDKNATIETGESSTSAVITFGNDGDYIIVGTLTVGDTEVKSNEMVVTVEKALPIVEFDHYFTDIDESLVETTDLIVTTSNSSIFTKNTNVVSNYDDAYIISCASVEEARFVYSYYVDKVDTISDLSKVISIATTDNDTDVADLTDLNDGNDALSNLNDIDVDPKDYQGYIALIDTGATEADEQFSVVGDDLSDATGHGSTMLKLIKAENPDAKVMSIKVFNGSKTDAASVYAGIMLAVESKVSVINLSLVGSDVEKNAIVKEAIQTALDNNIVVIGAAGNYNVSAKKFIPGCINGVITVGAANEDGTKYASSNTDADVYVIATSTSEATAIYTGLYTANKLDDERIISNNSEDTDDPVDPIIPDDAPMAKYLADALGTDYWYNGDGTYTVKLPDNSEGFETAASNTATPYNDSDTDDPVTGISSLSVGQTFTGTCTLSGTDGSGEATASAFKGNNWFSNAMTGRTLYASCDAHWGNSTGSLHANCINLGTVYYLAEITSITASSDNSEKYVNFMLKYSDQSDGNGHGDFSNVKWTTHTDTYTWETGDPVVQLQFGEKCSTCDSFYGSVDGAKYMFGCGHDNSLRTADRSSSSFARVWGFEHYTVYKNDKLLVSSTVQSEASVVTNNHTVTYYEDSAKSTVESNIKSTIALKIQEAVVKQSAGDYGGNIAHDVVTGEDSATQKWETPNRNQIYRSKTAFWEPNRVFLYVEKDVANLSAYTPLFKLTDYYSLQGTHIIVTDSKTSNKPIKDADGNDVEWTITGGTTCKGGRTSWKSSTIELDYATYAGETLYIKETQSGRGFQYSSSTADTWKGKTWQSITMPTKGGETGHGKLSNEPLFDAMDWGIVKVNSDNGKSGSDWEGDIKPINATYTITQYQLNNNGTGKTGDPENVWTCKTDANGYVNFQDLSYYTSTNKPYATGDGYCDWPYGYYEIEETAVSLVGNKPAGTKINPTTYHVLIYPTGGWSSTDGGSASQASIILYADSKDNWIYKQIDGGSVQRNLDYKITLGDGTQILGTDGSKFFTTEPPLYCKLGLLKADDGYVYSGKYDVANNVTVSKPQGDATYKNAQYQVFVSASKADTNWFDAEASKVENAGKVLTLDTGKTSIQWTDGLSNTGTHTFGETLYPVLVDGQPLYMVTGSTGYAETSVKLPQGDAYVAYEVVAPTGYHIQTSKLTFDGNWSNNSATGANTNSWVASDGSTKTTVPAIQNSNRVNSYTRDGLTLDRVYHYGIKGRKVDVDNIVGQGSGTTNGIEFAVINRSTNSITLNSQYVTLDTSYIDYSNGSQIAPGHIVAILTTHTVNNEEGVFRMNGLPYGTYEVVELRHNNTFAVGDAYAKTGGKAGNSIFANESYLYDENSTGSFDLHGTTESVVDLKTYDAVVEDNYEADNQVFKDGFYAYKMDTDDLDMSEGDASANGIKYAVVNTSTRSVKLKSADLKAIGSDANFVTYNDGASIAPNRVVAIIETHQKDTLEGYLAIYGLPYGTYTVYELRRDNNVKVNDIWANADKGTSIYANDSFYFESNVIPYDFTDTYGTTGTEHAMSLSDSFNRHHFSHHDGQSPYQDEVFRDGFSFWKRDLTYNKLDSHPQGDATFNGITYAVVNMSDKEVVLYNKYNTVETDYVTIENGKKIQPGQVAAILTSHQKNNLEGYVAMAGLPYGRYMVYELKADNTLVVGDTYDGSSKLGSSIYANKYPNMNTNPNSSTTPSMLFDDITFEYTLTDTGLSHLEKKYDTTHLHNEDDVAKGIAEDETVYGSIKIIKYDRETAKTGEDGNQGQNSFEGIRYAIVNRSTWSVSYPYDSQAAADQYAPGQVIAVVTADKNGEALLEHMCYGRYDVYELKWDSTIAAHDVYDTVRTNPAKFGKDHRANRWYCWNESIDNVTISNRDLQVVEVKYIVTDQIGDMIRSQDEQNLHEYYNLPIRGDLKTIKVDIDGKRMPRIPFLVSLVKSDDNGNPIMNDDGTYDVLEEHVIVTDEHGEINTRDFVTRPKNANNVNKLDGKYDGVDFTGTKQDLINAAHQNIWFGDWPEYQSTQQYLVDKRGSLLSGTYVLQELRLSAANGFEDDAEFNWNTEKYDMISSKVYITEDNKVVEPADFDIGVDIPPYIKSVALDSKSLSNAIVPDVNSQLEDTIEFGNLNSTQRYGFESSIYRIKNDGTKELMYQDPTVIPLDFETMLKLTTGTDGKTGVETPGLFMNGAVFSYDDATKTYSLVSTKGSADPVFNVVHDFQVVRNIDLDTSMLEEGESIAFTVNLYKNVGSQGWVFLMPHNDDLTEETQKIGVLSLTTETVNKTSGSRVGTLGGYEYTNGDKTIPLTNTNSLVYNKDGEIIGYTLVDDKITFKNLASNHNYRVSVALVDDNGELVKDVNGVQCEGPYLVAMYSTDKVSEFTDKGSFVGMNGAVLERNIWVPRDVEFYFSDLGLTNWVIPNNTNVHVVVTLKDAMGGDPLKVHNIDLNEESENIRWIDIKTTAMSEEGEQGILPNGKSWDEDGKLIYKDVVLRDKIDYSNCAEDTTVRVEGHVYLVDYAEDGSRSLAKDANGKTIIIASGSETFTFNTGNGSVEMNYTVNFGDLAKNGINLDGRDLVICERAFIDVDYKYTKNADNSLTRETGDYEVLVALHEDINDKMQTVSIPKIETKLVNKHEGTDYKVVSRQYADVTLYDTVTYTNVKPGMPWTVTATLMDQATKKPVLDADGNVVTGQVTITPTEKNGKVVVPITFKQVLTGLDWESDPSWVCFEDLKPGTPGHTDLSYAIHNNINDNDQTVHLPTFRTTVMPNEQFGLKDADGKVIKQIIAAPDQTVTDTVEIKNVGLDTIIDENYQITGFIPSVFTLKIQAMDAESGEPILDKDGNPYVATKKVTIEGKVNEDGTFSAIVNGEVSDGEVTNVKFNDGEIDWTVVKFGTDAKPLLTNIDLTIDATELGGKTIAYNETLYFGEEAKDGSEVLVEDTLEHVEQMVTVPEIGTLALDSETGSHIVSIVPDINRDGVIDEKDDTNGDGIISVADATDINEDGVIDILDAFDTNNDGVVDEEDVINKKIVDNISMTKIAPNTDYVITTKVVDKETGKFVQVKNESGELVDLEVKSAYHSPETTPADVEGTDLVCEHCGEVYAIYDEFKVDIDLTKAVDIDGKTLVVYEYMTLNELPYATHEDIEDENQTVIVPSIKTEFIDTKTETHVVPLDEDATVVDTVSYTNLDEGISYTMVCTLMDKDTYKPLTDDEGNTFTKEVTFVAEAGGKGVVEIEFTLDKDMLHKFETVVDEDGDHVPDDVIANHGTSIVAYEQLWSEDKATLIALHADIKDNEQTILVPRIFTHLTDTVIGDHVSRYGETEVITDTVTFVSLQADKEYTMSGVLINVDTQEEVLDKDGNPITASKTFTPNKLPEDKVTFITNEAGVVFANGEVDLEFTVDTTYLKGTHVVAFEDCDYEEIRVATHSNIEDTWQWTYIPTISTTLVDRLTDDKITTYGETVDIVDKVAYDKLLPGVWYEMSGILMDKETGKPVLDKDGNAYESSVIFMPTTVEGEVDVTFTIDTNLLEGKTLVAFEKCYYIGTEKTAEPKDEPVAVHEDITDVDQTIYIPKLRTRAEDKADGDQALDGTKTEQTIIDTVKYENLLVGKEYTIKTKLAIYGSEHKDEDGNVLRDENGDIIYDYVLDEDGNVLEVETILIAEAPESDPDAKTVSGQIDIPITFDASKYAGVKVVVFEDIYYNSIRVSTHSDIEDEDQTIVTSLLLHVQVAKVDADNKSHFLEGAEITIYEDADCTKIAKDVNGNDCVGTTDKDGLVEFTILTYDVNATLYAKETKAPFGFKLCEDTFEVHPDTDRNNDESAGTCKIDIKIADFAIVIPPKTGDNLPIVSIVVFSLIGLLCIGAFFSLRPRKALADSESNVDDFNTDETDDTGDSVVALMTEDIDGGISDHSGFDT